MQNGTRLIEKGNVRSIRQIIKIDVICTTRYIKNGYDWEPGNAKYAVCADRYGKMANIWGQKKLFGALIYKTESEGPRWMTGIGIWKSEGSRMNIERSQRR